MAARQLCWSCCACGPRCQLHWTQLEVNRHGLACAPCLSLCATAFLCSSPAGLPNGALCRGLHTTECTTSRAPDACHLATRAAYQSKKRMEARPQGGRVSRLTQGAGRTPKLRRICYGRAVASTIVLLHAAGQWRLRGHGVEWLIAHGENIGCGTSPMQRKPALQPNSA